MGWRGPAMLTLLLVLGAASGFAVSRGLSDASASDDVAEPVSASGPSVPGAAAVRERESPTDDPLPVGLELTEATLGAGRSAITYPVPVGWKPNHSASNAVKWKKPGTSNNTYVMRVSDIRLQQVTAKEELDATVAEMDAKGVEKDFHLERQKATSIEYNYLSTEGTRRHSFMSLVDLDQDGLADVEVIVHGREVDEPGAIDLINRIVDDVRVG